MRETVAIEADGPPPRAARRAIARADERAARRRRRLRRTAIAGSAATIGGGLVAITPAEGTTYTVTNELDSGAGSLRQALADANVHAGPDVITFGPSVHSITLTTGALAATDDLSVVGPGASSLTIDGNNSSRIFELYSGATPFDVSISGVTLTHGHGNVGGAIVARGVGLTIESSVLTGNEATTGEGGGLNFIDTYA
jgi:hypothetical protein